MNLREAIRYIVDNVKDKSFTQACIASETNIQRTQINTFLRKDGTLPENSRIKIARYLLGRLEFLNKRKSVELKDAVETLDQFLSKSPSSVTESSPIESDFPDPCTPLDSKHWAYVERKTDKEFDALLQAFPLLIINIVGGAKTGKTSLLRKVRHFFHQDECLIFELDCAEFSEARKTKIGITVFSWMSSKISHHIGGLGFPVEDIGYLENGHHFPGWILGNIMANAKVNKFLFLIDNLEMLYDAEAERKVDDFNELLGAIFEVAEVYRHYDALGKCKFIIARDEGHKVFREIESHESTLKLVGFSQIIIENLRKTQVSILARNYGINEDFCESVVHQAWSHLAGHPFLTQVYLSKYRENERKGMLSPDMREFLEEAVKEPINSLCAILQQRWATIVLDEVGRYLSKKDSRENEELDGGLMVADISSMLGVDSSGLFSLEPRNHHMARWNLKANTKFLKDQLAVQWRLLNEAR